MNPQKRSPRLDLNPSSAERWTTCTASPHFILENWDRLPPSDTVFSREGTTAHSVASALLLGQPLPKVLDEYNFPTPITTEMHQHGWDYSEYVEGLKTSAKSDKMVEQKIPLWYMIGRNAIVDAAVFNRHHSLHIVDYKYGEGVIVSTEGNLQLIIYAFSVAKVYDLPKDFPISLHIYQPRGRNADDSPSHTWQATWGEIEELGERIKSAAIAIQEKSKGLQFRPSDKACQWCPAKGFCDARREALINDIAPVKQALSRVQTTHLSSPHILTPEQLAIVVQKGAALKKWIDDANSYALEYMKAGNHLEGFKLVLSRGGNRYWANPVQAAKLLAKTILREDEIYEKKLIGPAAVEKKLGKDRMTTALTNLISRPPGNPVIAPADDKRDEYAVEGSSEFSNLDATSIDDF